MQSEHGIVGFLRIGRTWQGIGYQPQPDGSVIASLRPPKRDTGSPFVSKGLVRNTANAAPEGMAVPQGGWVGLENYEHACQ